MKLERIIRTVALAISLSTGIVYGLSNIDPPNKFAWGENIGWTNWLDANATSDGVVVGTDFLSGFIWAENVGWINVGDGTPVNGLSYANVNTTDFGVNIDVNGDLFGYAWGENIGWINFDTSGQAPDQARFDFAARRFRGYAWAENGGWINLDHAIHYVATTCIICQLYGDLVPTCVVDVDDILYELNAFIDPEGFPNGDIVPCGGNGVTDVDDILAELDAFLGIYACPHPCPP